MTYAEYQEQIREDIQAQLKEYAAQPVIFAGAGLSRRWLNAPSWRELLENAIDACPLINRKFAYYQQQYGDYPAIASSIAKDFREWAWGDGQNQFPADLFVDGVHGEIYLKHFASRALRELCDATDWAKLLESPEVRTFQSIKPHSIITTNYDDLLEQVFPLHEPVLAHEVITNAVASLGEIVKVHGTIDEPDSLVLTSSDYERFVKKRRYISAKLLTYFREHVVVFVGYSIEDQNIRDILSDIDEAFSIPGELAENIYFVEWVKDLPKNPQREKLIRINDDKSIRVKCVQSDNFSWVFEAFAVESPLANVSPRMLRTILARAYHLVRSDLPRKDLKVDFEFLEGKIADNEEFAKLFGVSTLADGTEFNARFPLSLTEVAVALGRTHWTGAQKLLDKVKTDKGIDLKEADNRYHCRTKSGPKTTVSRYSKEVVDLLKLVADGQEYEIKL